MANWFVMREVNKKMFEVVSAFIWWKMDGIVLWDV